jgi:hypothetical protein
MELEVSQPGVELEVSQPGVELEVSEPIAVAISLGSGFLPPPNRVTGLVDGVPTPLTLWMGSAAEFDAISPKDPFTVYIVTA